MPSEKILEQKKAAVAALADTLRNSVTGVLVEYKGISVADDTKLRRDLREAGVVYTVVKNTQLELAAKAAGIDGLDPFLTGTTALATSPSDYAAAARILSKYALTSKTFKLKTGFLDGKVVDSSKLDALAKLPTREILLATVCNAFQAPIAAFARAMQAVAEKAAGPAPAAEEAPAEA
ncbi:MAG: 50S ribosomal protein L10 [Oscillospiraceae bacterium]|jgi:large subunit ribosomal protein L10|nr:50S ribosomal protein L10 [Oscillospiraceae bacterium]